MSGNLNSEELITGLKQGDEASSIQFVKIYGPCLRSFIKKNFGLAYADIDEIIQETFYKAIKNVQKYQPVRGALFSTWVFSIAKNNAKDWLKKAENKPAFVLYEENISDQIIQPANDENLSEKGLLVRKALSSLDPVDREILERNIHGVPLVEIAKTLQIEEGTVRQRKFRALQKVKEIYENLLREHVTTLASGGGDRGEKG